MSDRSTPREVHFLFGGRRELCIREGVGGGRGKAMAKAMDDDGGERFDASTEALLAAAGIDR